MPRNFSLYLDGGYASLTAIEQLKSFLNESYQQALRNGLEPGQALAVILETVAEECARISADTT